MNVITRKQASPIQLVEIEGFIHSYMTTLATIFEGIEEFGLNVADELKMILGFGVKSGALAKFENLSRIVNDEISFDVWIKVNFDKPPLYFKLKTVINLAEKRAQVIEE